MSRNNASGNWSNKLNVSKNIPFTTSSKNPAIFKSFGYVFKNMGDGILKTPLGTRIFMSASVKRTQEACDKWVINNLNLGETQ